MNRKNKSCIIGDVEYESVAAAEKELGVSSSTLRNRFQSAKFPEYVRPDVKKRTDKRAHPCIIKGVKYSSYPVAAKVLGIKRTTIRDRLLSTNFPEYVSEVFKKKRIKKYNVKKRRR